MTIEKAHIIDILWSFPYISKVTDKGGTEVSWVFELLFSIEGVELPFLMHVKRDMSPMKCGDTSPLLFVNKDLLAYPHIMQEGNLCLHTQDCVIWEDRIRVEVEAVCEWIERYYIGGEKDEHYEDLVVNDVLINGRKVQFYYSQTNVTFHAGDYGYVAYTKISGNSKIESSGDTYLIQGMARHDGVQSHGEWSELYKSLTHAQGLFVILSGSPSHYGKFAMSNYAELADLCTEEQLRFVYEKLYVDKDKFTPVLWGYKTPNGKQRWLISYPDESQRIIKGQQVRNGGKKEWFPVMEDLKMHNVDAAECSYNQFYGRGKFPESITDKKIMVMGVGAIGSIVSTTLVRCGVKDITLSDYDKKYPGNVCRSEYLFATGKTEKIEELKTILESISPYVNVTIVKELHQVLKHAPQSEAKIIPELLDKYDIIFDCSIDSEMMWALDQVKIKAQIVNLSISNKANELVCAFSPGICDFVTRVYTDLINSDAGDIYNPEGCWSPTFKASYNDVQIMVQYALRYIVKMLSGDMRKANFMVKEIDESLRLIQW